VWKGFYDVGVILVFIAISGLVHLSYKRIFIAIFQKVIFPQSDAFVAPCTEL